MEPRLKSFILVDALRFRLDREFVAYYVEHKGDPDAGTIYLQFLIGGESYVFTPQYDFESDKRMWSEVVFGEDAKARDYMQAVARTDPDFWHIEIEWRKHLADAQALLAELGT